MNDLNDNQPANEVKLQLISTLVGHNGWVTQLATNPKNKDMLISASRDKSLIVWRLEGDEFVPKRRLTGHSHFVSDVCLSSDGNFALSGSWDKTLRLWDLEHGESTRRFEEHTNDVLSVAFSADNRQIISGSRDKTIKLWNTLAECKYTIQEDGHGSWVSCVRFSPTNQNPCIVSCGWDRVVKTWNLSSCKLKTNYVGHTGVLNTVTLSPDGSLCASGGKDTKGMLWDLNTEGNPRGTDDDSPLFVFNHSDEINALSFAPNRYWLCVAAGAQVSIWDLEKKKREDELRPEVAGNLAAPQCLSMAWSGDGKRLFTGYSDNRIRVWGVIPVKQSRS